MLSIFLKDLSDDTSGATAIEYGLIVALLALATLGAMQAVAETTIGMWNNVSTEVVNAISG